MHSKKTVLLFVFLLAVGASGIYYKNVNEVKNPTEECDISSKACTFADKNGKISVKFLTEIVVEEEVFLEINLPQGLKLSEAWIEGVNMYMGKTPIIFEEGKYLSFLGSCNLREMKWRLHLNVADENGQETAYSAIFFTYSS